MNRDDLVCDAERRLWDAFVTGDDVDLDQTTQRTWTSTPGMTNWTYPAVVGATAAIKQANVNRCLQLDYGKKDAAGMPVVIGASCVNDDAEKWKNFYDTAHHRTMFQSYWAIKNLGGPLCLYGDPEGNNLAMYDCDPGYAQIAALEDWSTS